MPFLETIPLVAPTWLKAFAPTAADMKSSTIIYVLIVVLWDVVEAELQESPVGDVPNHILHPDNVS